MTDLLALVLQVRKRTGRPLDAAGLDRVRQKISMLTDTEATAQRRVLRNLLGVGTNSTANRDRP